MILVILLGPKIHVTNVKWSWRFIMSEINSSNFKKEHGDLAPDLVGVTELTSPYFFVPPSGTQQRDHQIVIPAH